ncbi:MAG: Uma2 family endonuclease [Bacteroidota bacterium]
MQTIIETPPRTLLEVYKSLPEGTLIQLIENNLIMSPASLDGHQKILGKLYRLIGDFVEDHDLGEVRFSPYDVYLDTKNAFQPDLVFVAKQNVHLIQEDGLHGAPDLVLEVLSPSNRNYDMTSKKDVYERSGIKEYWMVDPETRNTIGYTLVNGKFQSIPSVTGLIASGLLLHEFSF